MGLMKCDFSIIQYMPNPIRGEFINIGIFVRANDGVSTKVLARMTSDWSRVVGFDPDADVDTLEALKQDFYDRLNAGEGSAEKLSELLENQSLGVRLSSTQGALAQNLESKLEELMALYVI